MVEKKATAKKPADKPAEKQEITPVEPTEMITVVAGNEHYAPIAFFSFDVGPLTLTSPVRETETYEDAIERCQGVLNEAMQNQFTQKMEAFFDRCGQLDAFMAERGMATRSQQDTVSRTSSKPQADMTKPPEGPKEPPTTKNMLGFVGNPVAQGAGELPTSGQNTLFGKLQTERNVDGRALCMEIFNCEPHNLHKAAMSKLLDYINDNYKKPEDAAVSQPAASAEVGKNWTGDDQPF